MKNRAIVTGGAGFIGSHLVDRLIWMGFDVLVIDNLSTGSRDNLNSEAEFLYKDIRDRDIDSIMKDYSPDYIFHLAAQIDVRKSLKDPIWDENINIQGTLNLLNAVSRMRIKKFIFSSTGGAIYGEAKNAVEEQLPEPSSPYAIGKLTCEHYLRVYFRWKGVPFSALRYGNVFGPRQDPYGEAGVVAIFCGQLLGGERPVLYGFGKMIRDYVYVSDIVHANILAMEKGEGGIYNIGSGKPTSVNELFSILKRISGRDIKPKYADPREGEIQEIYLNPEKASRELGWAPKITLDDGLNKTYKWFEKNLSCKGNLCQNS
ncbi:MAG: GDP-mannose 4,6-dehydratase [candidate division WOR-3 bacterium]|nr:GDP-mannose 4,6-dehydratase [candidate division WOR-3 bacterium]